MPRIVYVHGFNSSPQSAKGRLLEARVRACAPRCEFHMPALHHRPARAMDTLEALFGTDAGGMTLVGSSLGGYYATWLAERHGARAVLVNPALDPCRDLASMLGPQRNLYTGETYELTTAHFDELARFSVPRATRAERYLLFVQSGDEVLDPREAIRFYAGAWQCVEGGGSHGFERFERHVETVLRFAGATSAPWPNAEATT